MVDRYEMIDATPATVVDLDGTYIAGNTLRMYIKCGLIRSLRSGHVFNAARVVSYLLARRLRFISHITMKAGILTALGRERSFMHEFIVSAKHSVNVDVETLIENERRLGHRVLLATAAPDFYVKELWSGDFVATTDCCNEDQVECRGDEKLRRVREWLEKSGCHLHMVVTDHQDDAPLVCFNHRGVNVLVRPDRNSLSLFRKLEPAHLFFIEDFDKFGVTR